MNIDDNEPQSDYSHNFRLTIDGCQIRGALSLDVVDPSTGRLLATCARANQDQLDVAVAAAKAAFPGWSALSMADRRNALLNIGHALEARAGKFAHWLTKEQGKPLAHATGEILRSVAMLRAVCDIKLADRVLRDSADLMILQQHLPLGVVAAITPWNYPIMLLMMQIVPALLTGNTVVAKPAPTTPLTTMMFGELCADALPPGVFNVIVDDNDLGSILTQHPDVAKITFTGSTSTGKKVMASAAGTLKRVTLELGGNDAAIVLDDVDVKEVSAKIYLSAMANSGQVCLAIKRVYVPASMYEAMCAEIAALAEATIVGDGLDPATTMGPLQNKEHFEKVKSLLDDARENGRIIAGGKPLERAGYFVPPTIVRDIADASRLVQEEQFAPILPILKYSHVEEVILRVNNTQYGLGSSVWGTDLRRAFEIAQRIACGTVWINKHLELAPDVPFSGAKQSGIGTALGREGLEAFTQTRIINMNKRLC